MRFRRHIIQAVSAAAFVVFLIAAAGKTAISQTPDAGSFCDASAATHCFDFNSRLSEEIVFFGNAAIQDEDSNGYLSITNNTNWQMGTTVFPAFEGTDLRLVVGGRTGAANSNHHIDNIEVDTEGEDFRFSADVRMGGGSRRPADGFSISFTRPDDPVLESGVEFADHANHQFPEEGTQTGLSVAFDEWANNEPWDETGISVRYENAVIAQFLYPTLNGKANDSSSLQTGPNLTELEPVEVTDANQFEPIMVDVDDLAWTKISIQKTANAVAIVYKGNTHNIDLSAVALDCNGDGFVRVNDLSCSSTDVLPQLLRSLDTLAGDLNLDGQVSFPDFLILANNFGEPAFGGVYTKGDTNLNGTIDFLDFLTLAQNFGRPTANAVQIPEPATCLHLVLAGLAAALYRRRRLPMGQS